MALIIRNALLWDASKPGLKPVPQTSIVCVNGKISRIAPDAEVQPAAEDQVIDAAGRFVMPGMIDCHVHVTSTGDADSSGDAAEHDAYLALRASQLIQQDLEAGFTTVRNMGSRNFIDLAVQRAQKAGFTGGSRIITSGPALTMTGGHGWGGGHEVDGCDEARKMARHNLKKGVEMIKIMATGGVMTPGVEPGSPQLTEEEMRAAVEEAHKAGRRTGSHAQGTEGIKNAIRAGIDTIEHGIFLDDEAIQMMIDNGTTLVPTLVAPFHINEGGVAAGIPAYAVEKAGRVASSHVESFKKALKAGVRIAMGTDSGTPLNRHGENALELQFYVEYGMTPEQALLSTTKVAAETIDRAELLGTLEVGKLADILIIDGNPLEDISVIVRKAPIKVIIKEGQVMHERA